jgi:hypothetical protein
MYLLRILKSNNIGFSHELCGYCVILARECSNIPLNQCIRFIFPIVTAQVRNYLLASGQHLCILIRNCFRIVRCYSAGAVILRHKSQETLCLGYSCWQRCFSLAVLTYVYNIIVYTYSIHVLLGRLDKTIDKSSGERQVQQAEVQCISCFYLAFLICQSGS